MGSQHGEGTLLVNGKTVGYYNTVDASYCFQAGIQKYGYTMFFMTDSSLDYLHKSDGFEVGSAPSLVVVDTGVAAGSGLLPSRSTFILRREVRSQS